MTTIYEGTLNRLDIIRSNLRFKNKSILNDTEKIMKKILTENKYLYGIYHNKTIITLISYALVLEAQGKIEDVIIHLKEVISIKTHKYGKLSQATLAYKVHLAQLLQSLGRSQEIALLFSK
jgi:hypothetical protein